ncbi:hypothetical protein ACLOJK_034447, partial [Asimina triloba]
SGDAPPPSPTAACSIQLVPADSTDPHLATITRMSQAAHDHHMDSRQQHQCPTISIPKQSHGQAHGSQRSPIRNLVKSSILQLIT